MENTSTQILKTLETELAHRLEKLWRVFSWCSGILISLTGAIIVANRAIDKFKLFGEDRIILTGIIVTITFYGCLWIEENLKFEKNIRNEIDKVFEEDLNYSAIKKLRPDKARFGYMPVISLLGLVALIAVWSDLLWH